MCPSCNYIEKESREFTNTLDKRDCTDEAIATVRDYLFAEIEDGKNMAGYRWSMKDGRTVDLLVKVRSGKARDGDDIYSQEEAELLDKLSEVGCINAISPKEATVTLQRAMSDSEATMSCEVCIHYPPSACDGKPCCICDSDNIYLNCFEDVREYRNKK